METAVANGYLDAKVPGRARKRQQERERRYPVEREQQDWAKALASSLGQHGFVAFGPSPDGPVQ